MVNILSLVAAALSLAPSALAWGALGHQTVGAIATEFLTATTLKQVQTLLGSEFSESLSVGATWADDVREEAAFKFSAPYHFIDAEVSAIQNYTTRLLDTSLSSTQRQQALLFVDHFIGDIGQPLHDEALELGGNDIDAVCNGDSTNLHATWDTGMLETSLDARFDGSVQDYADSLVTEIKTGSFKTAAASWDSCITTSALKATACPLTWAQESNAFDCTNVFDFTKGEDLCKGAYFNAAIPIIDEQLAKQGFRLGAWLNLIFDP